MSAPTNEPQRPLHTRVIATPTAKGRAPRLRRNLSPPERIVWSYLKNRQLGNLRFRKQHPIGPWIADFYCHEAWLVVEIDGRTHNAADDRERDEWMEERDIAVVRFQAAAVFGNLWGVLGLIEKIARERIERHKQK